MKNLIEFFIRRRAFFLYLLYMAISVVLIIRTNPYHQSRYFSSINGITGGAYDLAGNVTGYFALKQANQDLLMQNGQIAQENQYLKSIIQSDHNYEEELQSALQYDFKMAQVINNQVTQSENYITLNRGARDGIKPHMGVVDRNGIVGIVSMVSDKYSLVISLLNTKLKLSAKVKGRGYFGSLQWDGSDPTMITMMELPRHASCEIGDTIVSSGYSAVFPEGIDVGVIESKYETMDDNFQAYNVRLITDFFRLNDVRVIINNEQEEQKELENRVNKGNYR